MKEGRVFHERGKILLNDNDARALKTLENHLHNTGFYVITTLDGWMVTAHIRKIGATQINPPTVNQIYTFNQYLFL